MATHVTLTSAAAKFIQRIVRFSGQGAQAGLRLCVTPGGCSGYAAEFSAAAAAQADEVVLEVDGMRLFVAPSTQQLLDGMTVDFMETATQSGFVFTNPNQAACACSTADAAPKPSVTKFEIGAITRGRPPAPAALT